MCLLHWLFSCSYSVVRRDDLNSFLTTCDNPFKQMGNLNQRNNKEYKVNGEKAIDAKKSRFLHKV